MRLEDLLSDVRAQVPEAKQKVVDELAEEYGASTTFHFLMMLLAAATTRERRIVRFLLRDLEKVDLETSGESVRKVDIRNNE